MPWLVEVEHSELPQRILFELVEVEPCMAVEVEFVAMAQSPSKLCSSVVQLLWSPEDSEFSLRVKWTYLEKTCRLLRSTCLAAPEQAGQGYRLQILEGVEEGIRNHLRR